MRDGQTILGPGEQLRYDVDGHLSGLGELGLGNSLYAAAQLHQEGGDHRPGAGAQEALR